MSTSSPKADCNACNKSSLSLLLLRPSPIATHSDLQAPGSANVRPDEALVKPLIPGGLTESRPVLRLLRAGYVHLYIPSKDQWRSWRVSEQGDLLEQTNPLFNIASADSICCRKGHNASGFRLLNIPQAHTLTGQSIWLAFSANLWSDKLKGKNKANPKAMVQVTLGSASAPAFKPDAANLKRQVLECNVNAWRLPKVDAQLQPQFPFTSMAAHADIAHMAQTLEQAAACHPKTQGHALAVVLPDPVGYAAELNALRLARYELSKQELAKPENAHPLMSLQMLAGLRQSVVDEKEAKSWDAVSPVMGAGAFKDIMRVKPNPRGWPEGTHWEPIADRQDQLMYGPGMGRVVFPDHEVRRRAWAAEATTRSWERYRKYVDEGRLQSWKDSLDKKMLAAHVTPQKRFEADWWKARQHASYEQYFALHFDEHAANPVGTAQDHCAGTTCATEVRISMTPQPFVRGETFDSYLAELSKPATDPTAHMQRALAGNQSLVLSALVNYGQDERPDKLHDLQAGLLKGADETTVLGRNHIKYSWLLHAGYGLNTLAITQSLSATVAAVLAGLGGKGPQGRALVKKLETMLMSTQAMMLARQSAIKSTRLEVPIQVQVRYRAAEAQELLRARQAAGADTPSVRETNRMAVRKNGWVYLTLNTTNLDLQAVDYNPKAALAAGLGTVGLGQGGAAVLRGPQIITLSEQALATLLQRQATRYEKAAVTLREMAQGIKGGLSLDGHIGLVGLLLNGVSAYGTLSDPNKSLNDWENIWSLADSFAGTLGGLAQVTQSALSSAVVARAGQEAAKQSVWILGLGVAASGAGAFGGFATAAGQFVKAGKKEDLTTATLYGVSGLSFFMQGTTNLIQFAGAFSEFMITRGSQRPLWFLGARVAAGASTRLVAMTGLGLTGWGLVFLAGGLVFEIGLVLLTPNALQKHVQNTYFGQGGSGKDRYQTLAEEEAGIRAITQGVGNAESAKESVVADPVVAP